MLPTSGESGLKRRQPAATSAEVLLSVAAATGLVALLDKAAPIAGLGVVYLLAVLLIAIRRGELAALATAVLSVLALNYFFIEPRHRLTISDSENVVALGVLLIAAIVVGRLAATAREQAREAEERARLAAAREREAAILAEAASAVLAGGDLEGQLGNLSASVAASTSEALRVKLTAAPPEATGGEMVPLSSQRRPGWIWAAPDSGWARNDLERVAEPLGRLIDIAHEHERISSRFAESEATRRADAAKTALLHAISHDLRSPLTAITTAAAGLRAGSISETDRRELLSVIDDESGRLARLVDDLLDVSRIQAGAVNPRTDWCDLSDLTASAAAGVRARLGDHPIDFDLPPDLPLVQADAAQLERVFSNLLENAIRFSPEDEPVRISGGTGGRKVIVRVTDQGRGIAPARQAEVFEPFVGGRDGHAGSGLGLAICRGLVEANGGTIRLQSTPGLGTSFAVAVLVVDDEPQIVRGLKVILRDAGYDVETAESKEEALGALSVRPPDAVVLDLVLPDGSGVEVCQEVRSWSSLPILVLSAVGDEREKVRALDAGADDYVTKPFGTDELLARLRAVLRRGTEEGAEPMVSVGDLEIDLAGRSVRRDGAEVHLTPIEFDLLRVLATHRGKLVTHRQLLHEVWGPGYEAETHYLRVHFAHIRSKLEPEPSQPRYLITEPGIGYRLRDR